VDTVCNIDCTARHLAGDIDQCATRRRLLPRCTFLGASAGV